MPVRLAPMSVVREAAKRSQIAAMEKAFRESPVLPPNQPETALALLLQRGGIARYPHAMLRLKDGAVAWIPVRSCSAKSEAVSRNFVARSRGGPPPASGLTVGLRKFFSVSASALSVAGSSGDPGRLQPGDHRPLLLLPDHPGTGLSPAALHVVVATKNIVIAHNSPLVWNEALFLPRSVVDILLFARCFSALEEMFRREHICQ